MGLRQVGLVGSHGRGRFYGCNDVTISPWSNASAREILAAVLEI